MHDDEDVTLNVKAIGLAIGGAALAGLLFVLARRGESEEAEGSVEATSHDSGKAGKKLMVFAKDKAEHAGHKGDRSRPEVASLEFDVKEAERDLKAAAWDAQQEARAAESRLRAARGKVMEDAAHIATWVGHEARALAGEGKERVSHLRHRDDEGEELERLREEVAELRRQLGASGSKSEKDYSRLVSRLTSKAGPVSEAVATEAVSTAIAQLERSLKARGPALLAARDRKQMIEIVQAELGPILRDSLVKAAAAAFGAWDSTRGQVTETGRQVSDMAQDAGRRLRPSGHEGREEDQERLADVLHAVDSGDTPAAANGKHRFWHSRPTEAEAVELVTTPDDVFAEREEHSSKAGLFWGGAGLGLALYALLDADRRERFIRLANEASIQVQELVRDLQGYDDEFS